MIASLPMYWQPETEAAWQTFWALTRTAYDGELPELTPPEDLPKSWYDHWRDPDLVLSHTCGLPWRATLKDAVRYVITPDFGIECCAPGHYASVVLRRKTAPDGNRLAVNAFDSQSGWAAAQDIVRAQGVDDIITTGAHIASARAVALGVADLACVDPVTWRLVSRYEDWADALTVVETTRPTPALPLITAKHRDPAPLRAALTSACAQISDADKQTMGGLIGMAIVDQDAYFAEPLPPQPQDFRRAPPEVHGQAGENTA